jgi:hypothetical protein
MLKRKNTHIDKSGMLKNNYFHTMSIWTYKIVDEFIQRNLRLTKKYVNICTFELYIILIISRLNKTARWCPEWDTYLIAN